MDYRLGRFVPRVVEIAEGDRMTFFNADAVGHNLHLLPGAETNPALNVLVRPSSEPAVATFASRDLVRVKDDVYPFMEGFIVVLPHRLAAVTDERGRFEIRGVPSGRRTVTLWHESLGTRTVDVQVEPDGRAEVAVTFSDAPSD